MNAVTEAAGAAVGATMARIVRKFPRRAHCVYAVALLTYTVENKYVFKLQMILFIFQGLGIQPPSFSSSRLS